MNSDIISKILLLTPSHIISYSLAIFIIGIVACAILITLCYVVKEISSVTITDFCDLIKFLISELKGEQKVAGILNGIGVIVAGLAIFYFFSKPFIYLLLSKEQLLSSFWELIIMMIFFLIILFGSQYLINNNNKLLSSRNNANNLLK